MIRKAYLLLLVLLLAGVLYAQDFTITILHSNDGESAILENSYSGSIAQFATVLDRLRDEAGNSEVVVISAGDNYLAGLQYGASEGIFDARALSIMGFDVSAIGNHEFDFGPEGFYRFAQEADFPFVSANLDFSRDPKLAALVDTKLKSSIVKQYGKVRVGFIGATTESLPVISSPGKNISIADVEESLQQEVNKLLADGVSIIISLSHLQNVDEEKELASRINGVDVFVAGGGDNLLGNDHNDYLIREMRDGTKVADTPEEPYPYRTNSPNGDPVLVVATDGSYNYIGRLVVTFNSKGVIKSVDTKKTGPVAVHPNEKPHPIIQKDIVVPVKNTIADFNKEILAKTKVGLDGTRALIRTRETTMGRAITDAYLAVADALNAPVDFAITNGGGVRNSVVLSAGSEVSKYDVYNILPFSNYLTVLSDLSAQDVLDIFEHSVSSLPEAGGQFMQAAGIVVTYRSSQPAGSRVTSIRIGDKGIVRDGKVVDSKGRYSLVTNSFIAAGGDGYSTFKNHPVEKKVNLGVSYTVAFEEYLKRSAKNGVFTLLDREKSLVDLSN